MTINEMIIALTTMRENVGGDKKVAIMTTYGENDYIVPDYPIIGDFEDQDGNEYKCAFVGNYGGEEFTEKGIAHYKWNPLDNKLDYKNIPFDGYVNSDFPMYKDPVIINLEGNLHVKFTGFDEEDADIMGNEKMPGVANGVCDWNINIETGIIAEWIPGTIAKIYYKPVDQFWYDFEDFKYGPNYVPDFMGIDSKSHGDYIMITVDENGHINNWSKDKFLEEHKKNSS